MSPLLSMGTTGHVYANISFPIFHVSVLNSTIYYSFPFLLYIKKLSHTRIPGSFLSHEAMVQHPCSFSKKLQTESVPQGRESHKVPPFTACSGFNLCFWAPSKLLYGKNWSALSCPPWFCKDLQGVLYSDSVSCILNKTNRIF